MNETEFVRLCGSTLYHITPAVNVDSIRAQGLHSAAARATQSGVDPANIALRKERLNLPCGTVLNHQKPLRLGRRADFLDGHTLQSWAEQLDRRLYLAPAMKSAPLANSFELDTHSFAIDSAALFDALAPHIHLSPINSGNAARRPARRGNWLYVPASASVDTFRNNRKRRDLVKGRDSVREVSLSCAISPDTLEKVLA